MKKITVDIIQYTPLIHFQHDKESTLRASEVKPKLDKFIVEDVFEKDFGRCMQYLIGYRDDPNVKSKLEEKFYDGFYALNYKLKIEGSGHQRIVMNTPMYFVQDNENTGVKRGIPKIETGTCKMHFFSRVPHLLESFLKETTKQGEVKEIQTPETPEIPKDFYLARFFERTNFGARQSKGYGSFYINETDPNYYPMQWPFFFEVDTNKVIEQFKERTDQKKNKYTVAMNAVDLFYKSLRSGINSGYMKEEDSKKVFKPNFYFKSLLFLYASKSLDIQWEKKTIKETFFFDKQKLHEKKIENRLRDDKDKNEYPLFFPYKRKCKGEFIVKDLFGLSTIEVGWARHYYGSKIMKSPVGEDVDFTRIPSPLFFKVIEKKGVFYVYVMLKKDLISLIQKRVLSRKLKFRQIKNGILIKNLTLSFPDKFDYCDFMKFVFHKNNFDIDKYAKVTRKHDDLEMLKDIHKQLRNKTTEKYVI